MIENELRDAFARHEEQAPELDTLRKAIDVLAARRRRRRTATRTGAAAVAVALALAVPVQLWRGQAMVPAISTTDAAGPVETDPQGALNLLLLGRDQRGTMPDSRADTIMLLHLPADGPGAYLVSFQRDLVVDLPGRGRDRINASYYYNGAGGTRQVVENLTGVEVDGVVEVDFAALRPVVDLLGPVPVCLPQRVTSHHTGKTFPKGCRDYSGRQLEDLVRQRWNMPHGGYDRDRIGQRIVLGLAAKAGQLRLLRDANKVARLMTVDGITFDSGLPLVALAQRLEAVEPAQITGISQPTFLPLTVDGELIGEQLDPAVAPGLFGALRADDLDGFVSLHPDWVLQE